MKEDRENMFSNGCLPAFLIMFFMSGSAIAWGGLIAWLLR